MRRGLTAAGPRRPHLCGLRFLSSTASPRLFRHPLRHPVRHYPPTHRQSPTRRHKRPTLACPTTSSPAPKPTAHTHLLPRLPAPPPRQTQKSGSRHRNRHPTSASSPAPSAPRTGWEKAPSSCHVFHVRAARKSAAPHLSPPPRTRPHQGKAPEPAPTHPHPRPPAPLSDSLLTRPTQAPPLATPQRPKKRHPASRRPPPRAFPHLQVPPLPGRHKKSGSPLKAAALRSNRRAISYP